MTPTSVAVVRPDFPRHAAVRGDTEPQHCGNRSRGRPRVPSRSAELDAAALAAALRRAVRREVRFDDGSRAIYPTDGSNYRQVPIGVVLPRDADDDVAGIAVCRRFGAPVLPCGGVTSLAGQCCIAVLDTSKYMHRIMALEPGRKQARVEPGIVLDSLRDAAERHTLVEDDVPAF